MQAQVDVIVLGGMGLKYDDYLFFRDTLEKSGAMGRTVMFIHTASDPTVECTLVPDMALAVAEQFALAGKRVLVLLTDMTNYADAQKEMAITMELENEDEEAWMGTYNLLTQKPVIYAANVAEDDLANDGVDNSHVQAVRKYAAEQNSEIFVICAQIEEEISELDEEERKMFLEDLGLKESGLEKLVKASYHLLGLMSFLTSGEDETRAWTIKIGTKAPQAAGKIHSDFERGFIKAEVVNYQDLLDCGSYAGAREKGLVRMEGKEYVVQDGDVILFRFNV